MSNTGMFNCSMMRANMKTGLKAGVTSIPTKEVRSKSLYSFFAHKDLQAGSEFSVYVILECCCTE